MGWPTGNALHLLSGHTGMVTSMAFLPDSYKLASGSIDGTIRLWDACTGENLRLFEKDRDPIYTLAYSPDGNLLASGGQNSPIRFPIRLWSVRTGQHLHTLEGNARHSPTARGNICTHLRGTLDIPLLSHFSVTGIPWLAKVIG